MSLCLNVCSFRTSLQRGRSFGGDYVIISMWTNLASTCFSNQNFRSAMISVAFCRNSNDFVRSLTGRVWIKIESITGQNPPCYFRKPRVLFLRSVFVISYILSRLFLLNQCRNQLVPVKNRKSKSLGVKNVSLLTVVV